MRDNIGNMLRVIRETGCSMKVAIEALNKCNSWTDTIKYAKERV